MKKKLGIRRILTPFLKSKIARIMKLTFLFLLLGLMQLSANTYSQNTKLNLDFHGASVNEVLQAIEDQSRYRFAYSSEFIDMERKVDIKIENETIGEILKEVFKNTNVKHEVEDRHIMLYTVKENNSQQSKDVSGNVIDATGVILPGVTIVIEGTTNGTTTDFDGNFSLSNVPEDATLVFSFVGMKTQEILVTGRSSFNIQMEEDAIGIEEIVAVGYGTQKKSDLTASISQVDGADLERSTASNVAMALQGRASGIEMLSDGEPGKAPSIRIRGVGTVNSTEPLIVLDGVMVSADLLSKISPYEIESVEILKDAGSGAIYGTRAANGVILVTTKGGKYNQKVTTRVNVTTGISQLIKKYPVANGEDIFMLKRERYTNDGIAIAYPWNDEYFNKTRTDWQDEMYRTALFQDYNIQISGGGEKNTFNVSINYRDEEGTQINTWNKRLGINLKSTQKVSDRFTVEENIRLSWSKNRSNGPGGGTSRTNYAAYKFPPSIPVKWDESNVRPGQIVGGWASGKESDEFGDMWNPVYKATHEWRYTTDLDALINLKGIYDITEDLSVIGTGSYTHTVGYYEEFQDITPLQSRSASAPSLWENNSSNSFMLGELYLAYNHTTGGHNIAATGGTSAQMSTGRFMNMQGIGFASTQESQLVMNNADAIIGQGNEYPTTSLLSYYIRGTYNYESKYYFQATVRADGSSRFAEDNQWGYFPAVSAGWRISGEDFMSGSTGISNLKLNASYGQLGNQNVTPFQYLNIYKKDAKYYLNNTPVTGTKLSSFANPDITWETTTTLNILLETAFLDNKLNLDIAYFDKITTDMLLPAVKHYTSGTVSLPDANTGEMSNKGFEIEVYWQDKVGDFGYGIGANATFLKNKLLKLYGEASYIERDVSRTYEGEPISSFYGWETGGIYQNQGQIDGDANISSDPRKANITPGDVIFIDTNGDNLVDDKDRVHIGDGNPTALLGFNQENSSRLCLGV